VPGSTAAGILAAVLPADTADRDRLVHETLGRIGLRSGTEVVDSMSGGERKRLAIARGLIIEPEILLLDEPTNHLDIAGINWLESLLREARHATIFVTHDRYLIQHCAERVIEVDPRYPGGYLSVRGDYTTFMETRSTWLEQLEQYRANLANKVRREVEWLRRGAKARTTKQKARSDQARELVHELSQLRSDDRTAGLEFAGSNRGTRELLKAESITCAFGDRILCREVSLLLGPGSRLGIVGPNGSGKTTLLRTLLGQVAPARGSVIPAPRLRAAFLDQLRTGVNRSLTLRQVLCRDSDSVVFNGQQYHAAGWAQRFLFRPEQLSTPLDRLSGGEQARALLARIMVEPADLLVLDEPTNDLDIATLEVLEDAVTEFPGAVLLVTHDRYLLDRVCEQVLGLSGEGHATMVADYRQWERWLEELPRGSTPPAAAPGSARPRPARVRLSYLEEREYAGMERAILKAEEGVAALQNKMNEPGTLQDAARLQSLCTELAAAQQTVDQLYARWSELDERRRAYAAGQGES